MICYPRGIVIDHGWQKKTMWHFANELQTPIVINKLLQETKNSHD